MGAFKFADFVGESKVTEAAPGGPEPALGTSLGQSILCQELRWHRRPHLPALIAALSCSRSPKASFNEIENNRFPNGPGLDPVLKTPGPTVTPTPSVLWAARSRSTSFAAGCLASFLRHGRRIGLLPARPRSTPWGAADLLRSGRRDGCRLKKMPLRVTTRVLSVGLGQGLGLGAGGSDRGCAVGL
jgi:hypothetical protein